MKNTPASPLPCRLDFIFDSDLELFLLFRPACPLGCLQRVYFLGSLFNFQFYVGCCNAISDDPLTGRVHINPAITARIQIDNPVASFALFNNGLTGAVFEITSLMLHEHTICARPDGLTNHLSHLKKKLKLLTNNHTSVKDKGE
jgi:hypothetical protein